MGKSSRRRKKEIKTGEHMKGKEGKDEKTK
jgi:hypothetical protein